MAREIYTIVVEVRPNRVKVTAPALPGFFFEVDDVRAAYGTARQHIQHYLKTLNRLGKRVPRGPKLVRVESLPIWINTPRTMRGLRKDIRPKVRK